MADTVNERHCDICLAEFATKQVVERHKQKRTKCTPHPDVIARMTADGLPIPPHTPNPHEAPCPYCGEVLSTGQSLARHLAKAKKCSENIPRNTPAVASHSTSDPQSPELTHWQCQCIICDELKASKQSLARHLSKTKKCTPTIPIPRDLKCGECAEAFLDVLAYCNHVKSQHPVLAAEQKRILVAGIVPEEPHVSRIQQAERAGPESSQHIGETRLADAGADVAHIPNSAPGTEILESDRVKSDHEGYIGRRLGDVSEENVEDIHDDVVQASHSPPEEERHTLSSSASPLVHHIHEYFRSHRLDKPSPGDWILKGLTESQSRWYQNLEMVRYQFSESYPVDLDTLRVSLGYPFKRNAVAALRAAFVEGESFICVSEELVESANNNNEVIEYAGRPADCSIRSTPNVRPRGPVPTKYFLTLQTAQDFAMRAPGPKAREIRDMYIRVMALVMDYDKLSNLYDVQEAERLARHTAIVENTTLRSLVYISGLMWINGELRVKAGCTKETPKDRLKGLNPKFGMGKHRFLFHKVFFLANPHTVEREFKTNSKFAPYFSDVVLDNGSVSKETFRCDHATLDEICREMEKCAHRTGKQFEETAEDEREAIRQHEKCLKGWEHSVLMKTKQIEETVRIKELELQQAREVAEIERDTVIAKVELAKLELRGARAGL